MSDALARYLVSSAWREDAVEVKRNRRRVVYRCQPACSPEALYVKEDIPCGAFDRLKALLRCKAEQEFGSLQALDAAGIPVAKPLGWVAAPGGGLLATQEMPGRSLREILREKPAVPIMESVAFREALLRLLQAMLRAGLSHPDMHPGNVMVDLSGARPSVGLLDVYGVRLLPRLGLAAKRRLIRWLFLLLAGLPYRTRQQFLDRLCAGDPDAESLASWPRLADSWARFRARKWPGWRARVLGTSSVCVASVDELGTWVVRRDATTAASLGEALRAFQSSGHPSVESLKRDHKRNVARVTTPDLGDVVVKEYVQASRRWLWRPDRRGWLATMRARHLGLPVADCLGWVRASSGHGYLFQVDVGNTCLEEHLRVLGCGASGCRHWLSEVAHMLALLHLCHCFHADLKLANWVVTPESKLLLIDCDDVRHYRRLPDWARERNLRQLAESCPPCVTRSERLRFLSLYGRLAALTGERVRLLARETDF